MASADGERLTWRATGNQVDLALQRSKIDISNITMANWPILHMLYAAALIFGQRPVCLLIKFDNY